MTVRIAAVNGKGGAGKTTAVLLLAGELALQDKKVLLVDMDSGRNLALWWTAAKEQNNLPANITVMYAAHRDALDEALKASSDYDYAIFDTPGMGTNLTAAFLKNVDLVISPIQPTLKEIEGAIWAAQITGDATDAAKRTIRVLILRTRIAMTGRSTNAYRQIRPWARNAREAGFDVHLLQSELMERAPYKELYNGAGIIQIMPLTEPVKKARAEVNQLVDEIMLWLENPEQALQLEAEREARIEAQIAAARQTENETALDKSEA